MGDLTFIFQPIKNHALKLKHGSFCHTKYVRMLKQTLLKQTTLVINLPSTNILLDYQRMELYCYHPIITKALELQVPDKKALKSLKI
eukprot:snap_masked-scaffold_4-processed-gene-12.24-mRNA-1 protein AED:1.00 eAED:1.00 QI:0/0/0/0/1/1/2/0/86